MLAEFVRTIVAAVPLPLIAIGPDERIVAANPAAQALFGQGIEGRHHLLTLRQPGAADKRTLVVRVATCHPGSTLWREEGNFANSHPSWLEPTRRRIRCWGLRPSRCW